VLPLADTSGPAALPYLADSLTDQLITTIGQVSALTVTSRTSVLALKDEHRSAEAAARALGVDAVLEGTIALAGASANEPGRVRVNARLIAAGGGVLWSRSFERALGDTLALQADLARAIAEGVHAAMTPGEQRRLTQVRPTNAAAESAYFQGLFQLNQLGSDNMRAAVEAFRRATELDPDYALAHTGLARAHITLGFMRASSHAEARALALAAASRAADLDPESSAAHEVIADLKFYYDWDWAGAEGAYQKAIALNPSSSRAHAQYARYLIARGRGTPALTEAQRAVSLDPLSAGSASTLALMHYYTRDYGRAAESAHRALQLDPNSAGIYFVLARIHAGRGALAEAIEANDRAVSLAGQAPAGWRAHQILLQAQSGRTADARAALAELNRELNARNQQMGPGPLAYIHVALGDSQRALQLLERAADDRDPDLLWIAVDPRVDPLRSEPRLKVLLARLELP
jgi:TolB-like protein/Flp pilus assembly protein TadD